MRTRVRRRSLRDGAVAGSVLLVAVVAGSRGGRDLDPALFGYLAATFVAVIGGAIRVSEFWRRRPSAFYGRAIVAALRDLKRLRTALASTALDLAGQRPIAARSRTRWLAHMALSLGTLASFAITLPLVFGWLRFEARGDDTYVAMLAGLPLAPLALDGVLAWLTFHALSIAGIAVTGGSLYFLVVRLRTHGLTTSVSWRDLAPLLLLLAVALSGLALPASRHHPAAFALASALHEVVVVLLLVSLPLSKLGHVFFRPLQIGARLVRAKDQPHARCAGCGGELAASAQIAAVEAMLAARGSHTAGHRRYCPPCKRRFVAHAHTAQSGASRGRPDSTPGVAAPERA